MKELPVLKEGQKAYELRNRRLILKPLMQRFIILLTMVAACSPLTLAKSGAMKGLVSAEIDVISNDTDLNRFHPSLLLHEDEKAAMMAREAFGFSTVFTRSPTDPNLILIVERVAQNHARDFWNVSQTVSEIDESLNVHMHRRSEDPIVGRTSSDRIYPELWLGCRENRTHLWVDWRMFLGDSDQYITYRIDTEDIRAEKWTRCSTGNCIGKWNGTGIDFIKSLFGGRKLVIDVLPFGKGYRRATFDISGIEKAIKPLRLSCQW